MRKLKLQVGITADGALDDGLSVQRERFRRPIGSISQVIQSN